MPDEPADHDEGWGCLILYGVVFILLSLISLGVETFGVIAILTLFSFTLMIVALVRVFRRD